MKKILSILLLLWACSGTSQTIITKNPVASVMDSDNQQISDFSLAGNILSITIEGGNTKTVDLTPIVGNVTITTFSVVGSTLTLTLSNGSTANVQIPSGSGSTSLVAGTNVTITGTGTSGDPYIISSTGGGGSVTVEDNLTSTSVVNALSANQGRVLKSQVDNLSTSGQNPNLIAANTLTDITNAGTGAVIDIRASINISANYTPPADQTWYFSTGELILTGAFTLTGANTRVFFQDPLKGIDAFQGTLAGTWIAPDTFTANNLGARSDGNEVFDGANTTIGSTTVTSATAGFTAADVGKWISIVGAGRLQTVPFQDFSGNFNIGETLTFSGGGTATLTNATYATTTGTITATMIAGIYPKEGETITGTGSGATATVRTTITEIPWAHVTTIASYVNSTTITIADAALNTMTNTTMVYGWNDRNAIVNAAYLRNRNSGELEFLGGHTYFFNVIQANPAIQQVPYGFLIGNDMNGVMWNVNGRIQAFPHEVQDSKSFAIYRTDGSGIKGSGKIYGDYLYHKAENGRGEGNHGIYLTTLSTNSRLVGSIDCSYWYGDAVYSSADTQFMNQIDGANFVDGSTESPIEQGNILDNGTIDTANTEWWYSTNMLTLEGNQFNNITSRGLQRWVNLTGSSFGGWEGMRTPYFKIAFYDSGGNFMFLTNEVIWYDRIYVPDGATQARVVFVTPLDPSNIQLNLRPDLSSNGLIMEGWTTSHCGRQGISNGPSNAIYRNIIGHHIGGLNAGPGYWMDYEDGERIKHNIIVEGCLLYNNWGDIILKGPDGFIIRDNTFKASTIATNNSSTANIEAGISSLFGRNVKIYGNTIYNKGVSVDRQDHFSNNIMKGGSLSYTANANRIVNNQFWNVYVYHAPDSSRDRVGYPTVFKDNVFYYNMRRPGYWFKNNQNAASFIGNEFRWNWVADWNYAATDSDGYMVSSSGGFDSFFLDSSQSTDFGGIRHDNIYSGMLPSLATRDYASGNNRPVMVDSQNMTYEMPLEFTYGLPKSYTFENMVVYGWLEYDFLQYEASIISATPVISHIGGKLHLRASDNYPWANTGSNLLATASRNVSLYFKDFEFIIEQAFTYNPVSSQKFMNLQHLGTTVFENCTFDMQGVPNYVMDLTQGTNFGGGLGTIIFINPNFKNGFSIVLRSGDKILYTKPHPDLEVYADNTAALAGGIPPGYMYRTSDGTVKTTF